MSAKKMMIKTEKPRLEQLYVQDIQKALHKDLQLKNVMQTPKIVKIVLNIGTKEAVGDSKILASVLNILTKIAGQKAIKTFARKSIAGFKLREGMAIGAKVTLRRRRMYEFLDRLINLSLPKVRDFQGLSTKLDGRGGYNIGIKDWSIFPEVAFDADERIYGLNVTIQTSALKDAHGVALLKSFGMPFHKA
jgi:large subunit ribosomal protein L5